MKVLPLPTVIAPWLVNVPAEVKVWPALSVKAALGGIGHETCQCVAAGVQDLRAFPVSVIFAALVVMLPGIRRVPVTL